jgi:tryptophanyl-tRNA synthetase
MSQESILSALQPTGNTHLGNYLGAIKNWVLLQNDYKCYYGVVNYHAMTMPYKPAKLRQATWNSAFDILACGIKEENLFIQSFIPEHTELAWILGCMCSYGELSRMTQFKDKSQQVKESDKDAFLSTGLFTYPVLQAADILIYKASKVPVGQDQDQHLELTRSIANRFNSVVGKEYFKMPETLHSETPKILSTADPSIKMSSSKGDKHNIDLFAEPEKIRKQIRSAVTDSGDVSRDQMSPGVENLFTLMKAFASGNAYDELLSGYKDGSLLYGELKKVVGDAIVMGSEPMREKRKEIDSNKKEYKRRVKDSSAAIRQVAQQTLREVRELAGL